MQKMKVEWNRKSSPKGGNRSSVVVGGGVFVVPVSGTSVGLMILLICSIL